ncbi:MAG: Flp family type IVb pilin [Bdellovibrionales bacterium]|nr:Flp family type IVb pilin [Bdellovibrionales bacterium]
MTKLQNERGQGLIEYLILVALMAVATIGIVRVLNKNVNAQFANIVCGLQGKQCNRKAPLEKVEDEQLRKRDLSDFLNGSRGRE